MEYFTEKEIQDFKNSSINYPYIVIEKQHHEVIQISEIVSIAGMAKNLGTPTEITVHVHEKGKDKRELKYKLVQKQMTKEDFITKRTNIVSEMLDNPDAHGIYPTTECFEKLDKLFDELTNN